MFYNRKEELGFLEGLFSGKDARLLILYGRRRVGKSDLIQQVSRRHNGLYLLARQEAAGEQLKALSVALAEYFGDEPLRLSPLQNFDAFFEYLKKHLPEGVPVFFDEFPYLVEATPSLPSILQGYWDNHFQHKRTFFVLCGSSVRMMERLLGYESPVYGRRTEQLLLKPLGFFDSLAFMGGAGAGKAVEFYSVLGGTPAYLQQFDFKKPLEENLADRVLRKTAFLNQEAVFILREELDEPRNYFAIMKSVAKGNASLASIVNDTGLERGMVAKYLSVLSDLHLVERRVPITEKERSRRGLYFLADPYFRFWFRFVFENMAYIEAAGPARTVKDRVMPFFSSFVGLVFEDVALEWLRRNRSLENYVFGRWWENAEEIDIVGLDEGAKKLLLAEVKWSEVGLKDAKAILAALAKKASLVKWHEEGRSTVFCLIAKKIGGKEALRKEGFMAYDLQDIEK